MYLEIVCQKEETEQITKKLENDDLKCQSMENKIMENQVKSIDFHKNNVFNRLKLRIK